MEMPGEEDESMEGGYRDELMNNQQMEDNQLEEAKMGTKLDASLTSSKTVARDASLLAKNLDADELEAIAMCFDNIRFMRKENADMAQQNDDAALGDQFDENLTTMITQLTEVIGRVTSKEDRGLAVVSGKRDLMALLVDKTLEYLRVTDPSCEIVVQDITTQYELLLENAIQLINVKDGMSASTSKNRLGGDKPGTVMTKLL